MFLRQRFMLHFISSLDAAYVLRMTMSMSNALMLWLYKYGICQHVFHCLISGSYKGFCTVYPVSRHYWAAVEVRKPDILPTCLALRAGRLHSDWQHHRIKKLMRQFRWCSGGVDAEGFGKKDAALCKQHWTWLLVNSPVYLAELQEMIQWHFPKYSEDVLPLTAPSSQKLHFLIQGWCHSECLHTPTIARSLHCGSLWLTTVWAQWVTSWAGHWCQLMVSHKHPPASQPLVLSFNFVSFRSLSHTHTHTHT